MARSTSIYIVMLNTSCSCNENHALAAFTVKHELQSYLRRRSQVPDAPPVTVWRMRDNPTYNDPLPVDITSTILPV